MCGGQICGIEAAVHAARQAFDSEKCKAALLVDATNAFNSLNHQTDLQNIRRLCPPIATILVNTYRAPTELFVDNDVILSREGTTQGDPLAMAMYGLATIPLIQKVNDLCKQVWYADDSAVFGSLEHLRSWWDRLTTEAPRFGYFANPSKTWLVTKDRHIHNAAKIFAGCVVNITSHGRPYLGAPLGSLEFIEDHINSKVGEWTASITILSEIASSQPHAAYSALKHGLSSKWSYLSTVTCHLLSPLDIALRRKLLSVLTGRPTPNDQECALFALPTQLVGLGIRIPSKNAEKELQYSLQAMSSLVDNILEQNQDYGFDITERQLQSKASIRSRMMKRTLKKQMTSTVNCHVNYRRQLIKPRRKEHPPCSQPSLSRNMALHCIGLPSMTPWP